MEIAKYVVTGALVALWASLARGGTYSVPLDGLKGVYSNGDLGPSGKTISVDIGLQFARIDSVGLDIKGTMAPGLWRIRYFPGSPEEEVEILWPFYFYIRNPDSSGGADAEVRYDGAFDIQVPFTRHLTADWSFLNDGRAELQCQLVPPESAPIDIYAAEQVIPFLAGIEDARLVIQGQAVPEPGQTSLVTIVAAALVRRCRGRATSVRTGPC